MKITLILSFAAILVVSSGVQSLLQHATKPASSRTFSRGSSLAVATTAALGGSSAPPATLPLLKAPPAMYEGAVAVGAMKASLTFSKIFKLAIASGAHIGFGAYLALTVGGACFGMANDNPGLQKMILGSFGLPFGLIMTVVTGGELFTGNTALVTAAVMEGKASWKDLIKNWSASYAGNFVGSIILAYLAFHSGTLGNGPAAAAMATAKCALTWQTAFVRGLLCNWLIGMAIMMASGCASMEGKMIAVWFPVSAFVALGLDNSVANMFIIPLGMLRGAQVTIPQFIFKNLIPCTLGNIAGAICAVAPYGMTHGKWFTKRSD